MFYTHFFLNNYVLYTWSLIGFFVLKAFCYYSADISGAWHQSCWHQSIYRLHLSCRFLPATYVIPHIFLSIFISFLVVIDKWIEVWSMLSLYGAHAIHLHIWHVIARWSAIIFFILIWVLLFRRPHYGESQKIVLYVNPNTISACFMWR
jgi:hypothetical protein